MSGSFGRISPAVTCGSGVQQRTQIFMQLHISAVIRDRGHTNAALHEKADVTSSAMLAHTAMQHATAIATRSAPCASLAQQSGRCMHVFR